MPGVQKSRPTSTMLSTNIRQSRTTSKLVRKPTTTSTNSKFSIKSHVPKNPNTQFVIGPRPQTNSAQFKEFFAPSRHKTKLQSKPQFIQKSNPKFVIKPSAVPKPLISRPRVEVISHSTASKSFSSIQTTHVSNKNNHNTNNNNYYNYAGANTSPAKPKITTNTPSKSYQPKPFPLPPSVTKGKLMGKSKTNINPYKSSGFIPQPDNFVLPSSLKNKIKSQLPFRISTNKFNTKSKSISNLPRNRSEPKYVVRSAKSVQNDSRNANNRGSKSKPRLRRTKSKTSTYSTAGKKIQKPSKYIIRSKHSNSQRNQHSSQHFRTRSRSLQQKIPNNTVQYKYQNIQSKMANVQKIHPARQNNDYFRTPTHLSSRTSTGFTYQVSPPNKQPKAQLLPSLFPIYNQTTRMRSEQRPRFVNW